MNIFRPIVILIRLVCEALGFVEWGMDKLRIWQEDIDEEQRLARLRNRTERNSEHQRTMLLLVQKHGHETVSATMQKVARAVPRVRGDRFAT